LFDLSTTRLAALRDAIAPEDLRGSLMGLEKESLRVARSGGIAGTPHPAAWGSALTHPWLTTDYSEALAEFITPPMPSSGEALDFLADLQSHAYQRLPEEILWATSMPCVLAGDENIPIAEYGPSNPGRMKHIYRVGLGYRYGRVMQVIAGVHFNWSLPDSFWRAFAGMLGESSPVEVRDTYYMGMVRNLLRVGWLIPYLFGASPAVCKSFFANGESRLDRFDEHTFYEPYATSLRMGDIGYQNKREQGLGVEVCYRDVATYARSLLYAVNTPAREWEAIGVKVDGEYRQLNANQLQIENEYYNWVRPKQPLRGLESPAVALLDRGVQYVELRSLDVNAYHPLGVDEVQLRFLEALMFTCLLAASPPLDAPEQQEIAGNVLAVAHRGREPGLMLRCNGEPVSLRDWGQVILDAVMPVAEFLDRVHGGNGYEDAADDQFKKLLQPELTPSARMLAEMRDRGEGFYQFARRLSMQHHRYFSERALAPQREQALDAEVARSFEALARIEAAPRQDFDRFLADYFAQTEEALTR
jgi:glutamate--cysteine ligase